MRLLLGGSQRQQPANMFSVGAEGNVQLQHISLEICISAAGHEKTMTG